MSLRSIPSLPSLLRALTAGAVCWAPAVPVTHAQDAAQPAWDSVQSLLARPAILTGGYRRYAFPRRDLTVQIGDVTVAPGLALGGWVGFAGPPDHSSVMGDLVVTATELPSVLQALLANDLEVTAIHNHLTGEQPQVLYLHIHAHGPATTVARGIAGALERTAIPRPVAAAAEPVALDTARIFKALGVAGRAAGRVANLTFALIPQPVRIGADTMLPALALASPVNLQLVAGGRVVTSGDLAVLAGRVQPVLRALSSNRITPTAVHSHLIGESPGVTYIHFWGDGSLETVLAGLRAALDAAR